MSTKIVTNDQIRIELLQPMSVLSTGRKGVKDGDSYIIEFINKLKERRIKPPYGARRDFHFWNSSLDGYEYIANMSNDWVAGEDDEIKKFTGGLYAVITCTGNIPENVKLLKEEIGSSNYFKADKSDDPYRSEILSHAITPWYLTKKYNFQQMDLFLPIVEQ